jgi:hypothetical protein
MPTNYNGTPAARDVVELLAVSPNSRQDAITAYFHKASAQHNALMSFTSTFDPNQQNGGITSIFAEKTELSAGGKSKVHFNTIGMPAGPGAVGAGVLTGNESRSSINTYFATVDWVRDAIVLTEDEIQMIEAGRNMKATLMQLLAKKMGLTKQNHMLQRLKVSAVAANTYRVGNRASTNALTAADTLSLDVSNITRSMLNTLGATPLKQNKSKTGCPVNKFMMFATDVAMLPIRNSSLFSTAANADVRGDENANFTGEILNWQGNAFYEFPQSDMAWDDYKGGPLLGKAKVAVEAKPTTVNPTLVVNPDNTKSLYFQWFDGYRYPFSRQEALPNLSGNEYYFWACNPNGSRVFGAYAGNHDGNKIAITKILSPAQTGTTIDQATVGNLNIGGSAEFASGTTGVFVPGGTTASGRRPLPLTGVNGSWVYTDTIAPGAIILAANANGAIIGRSFTFAAMAGCFAHGSVKMAEIGQNFDYDFVMGNGYKMIFGTGVALDPLGIPNGYILIEHAIDIVGYSVPIAGAVA